MKYLVKFTSQFKKDIKKAKRQNKNIELLFSVIERLANGEVLDDKYRVHKLVGNLNGIMECHIEPDWILEYEYVDKKLLLICYRVGSHSDLLN